MGHNHNRPPPISDNNLFQKARDSIKQIIGCLATCGSKTRLITLPGGKLVTIILFYLIEIEPFPYTKVAFY